MLDGFRDQQDALLCSRCGRRRSWIRWYQKVLLEGVDVAQRTIRLMGANARASRAREVVRRAA